MTFDTKLMCSSAAILAIAACGSSSDSITADEFFSALEAGSVARALDDGKTLAAGNAALLEFDFDNDTTTPTEASFALRKTDDGNLAMTVDGKEFVFEDADQDFPNGYRFEDSGIFYGLYSFDGEITESLDPEDRSYARVYYFYADDDAVNGLSTEGLVVVGTQTELAQLDLLSGEAIYRGFMNADFYDADDFADFDLDRVRVRGDMEMTADFTDGTISGRSRDGDLTIREGGNPETGMDGALFYDATMIDGRVFGGTVSVDGDFLAATGVGAVTGEYEGGFYGPFADEAAGTITGTTAGGFNLIGQFNSRVQD